MDSGNGVISCKRDDWRLLVKDFKTKPIKEVGKIPNQQFQDIQTTKIFYITQ